MVSFFGTETSPSSGVSSPTIMRKRVVLPAPLGPTRPTFSPGLSWKLASTKMSCLPYCLLMLEKEIIRNFQDSWRPEERYPVGMAKIALPIVLFACTLAAQDIAVKGDQVWTDTNLDVTAGETIRLAASGTLEYLGKKGEKQLAGVTGLKRGFLDMIKTLPVNS